MDIWQNLLSNLLLPVPNEKFISAQLIEVGRKQYLEPYLLTIV